MYRIGTDKLRMPRQLKRMAHVGCFAAGALVLPADFVAEMEVELLVRVTRLLVNLLVVMDSAVPKSKASLPCPC